MSIAVVSSPIIEHLLSAPSLPTSSFLLLYVAIKTLLLPPGPQAPLNLFSVLENKPLFLSGKQSALSLTLLSNTALAPNLTISTPATFYFMSNLNIVSPLTSVKQTIFVLLLLSSTSITSFFLAQKIPTSSIFLSATVVKLFFLPNIQSISFKSQLDLIVKFST